MEIGKVQERDPLYSYEVWTTRTTRPGSLMSDLIVKTEGSCLASVSAAENFE
jgi:hypothetical protein